MQKATGSYRTYSSPVKTATLVPEFAVEDMSLGRTADLMPEFAVEDLSLGRTADLVSEFAAKHLPLSRTRMMLMNVQIYFMFKNVL